MTLQSSIILYFKHKATNTKANCSWFLRETFITLASVALVDKISCVLSELWSIILTLTLSLLKRKFTIQSSLRKTTWIIIIQPYTETSCTFSVETIFVSQDPEFVLFFFFIYISLKCERWCWPILIHWCIPALKQSDICVFIFFPLSLSWWLIVCNDAWLLRRRK